MLCALYTLMEKYRNRRIYIWNVNRDSINIFMKAMFNRIDIQGFVSVEKEYIGAMYMNRPVIDLKQIESEENSIILLADEVSEDVRALLPNDKGIYWAASLEINADLSKEKLIIYGTGDGEHQLGRALADRDMEPVLYCITKKRDEDQYKGKRIIEVTELEEYSDYSIIISVKKARYISEILDALKDFRGKIYIEIEDIINNSSMLNLIQNLHLALERHKKIYLYSKRDVTAGLIEEVLTIYGIEVSGYVYGVEDIEKNIGSIYDLAFEGIEDKVIIINEIMPGNMIEARDNVELAGFSLEKSNYAGIRDYTYAKDWLLSNVELVHDSLVGASILYPHGKPGWKVYGKEETNRIRILVLGGSTSSEAFYPENWISKLYYKLRGRDIKTTIYNGAHSGDDIVDEMLRLLRDGHVLQPHIVISMSGVNNLRYKNGLNQFNEDRMIGWIKALAPDEKYCSGVCSEDSLYSFWIRNEKILKVISEFYGAVFWGFLQPMNMTIDRKTLLEKSLYEQEGHIAGAEEFACLAQDGEGYINLMRLFEHQDEMFFDVCHYTEKAQEIIANEVFESIISTVYKLQAQMAGRKENEH